MYVGTIHAYCLNLLQQPPVYHFLKYSVLTDLIKNEQKRHLFTFQKLDCRRCRP